MNSTKGDNTPTNTLERLLYEYRYDSRAIDEDLVLQQNPADVEKAHQSNLEETKGQIEAMFAQAVNKARIEELEATVINPIAGKSWLDVRPDVELQRVHQRLRVLKLNELETPNQVEEIE